jgi:hypothetical protein
VSHTTWPNPYKSPEWHQQIWPTQLSSWQSITNSSPTTTSYTTYFYGTYRPAVSRWSHSGQNIQIWVLEFCDIQKSDFGILIHCKNGTVHRSPFLFALITLWAHAYPWDMLATCCCHTCQGVWHGRWESSRMQVF